MATKAVEAAREPPRRSSRIAAADFHDLLALPPAYRDEIIAAAPVEEIAQLSRISRAEMGTPFGLWQDDPVGFVWRVLGETTWSKQEEILRALMAHTRVVVPSAVGVGKTHIAARAVAHIACCWPVGTSTAVTIATAMRQVEKQLWPHVRRLHARAGLPGRVDISQWSMDDLHRVDTKVAYGFTAPPHEESAMQGIHSTLQLLLVVDEAGGIDRRVGRATRNLLTGDAHALFIGNPPTDDENSWFEDVAREGDDPDKRDVVTIAISAYDSPAVTGETVPHPRTGEPMPIYCRECPPVVPPHPLARHLNDRRWIDETVADYGENDPYVVAKVHARFPKGGSARAIPAAWVDLAAEAPDPGPEDGAVLLNSLGLEEETRPIPVLPGAWVRLGVDVAADGGDEFVIARTVGDVCTIEHVAAGPDNENAVQVAGELLRHIRRAEALAVALGSAPVRVKVDAIGVGWYLPSLLEAWRSEGMHDSEVVAVTVSEKPERPPDKETMRPWNKRAEMWLSMRHLLQPSEDGWSRLRLGYLDQRARAQLSGPKRLTNSSGFTVIERKEDMKKRGMRSPDRGEATLLAIYEPQPKPRKGGLLV